jgi:dihydroorotase
MPEVLHAMESCGMLLLVHAEHPKAFCLDREDLFIEEIVWAAETYPRLKIVVEHVTSANMVEVVKGLREGVAATITLHHLVLTLDDVVGGLIKPHHFCKPLAKRPEDRDALLATVMSGHPRFFFGSDSAPHRKQMKECEEGCAGIYTSPVAMGMLAEIFHANGELGRLEDFTSRFGAEFYGLPLNEGSLTIVREPWRVRHVYYGVVPFMAGGQITWRVLR